jgi:hypothetical protein
MKEYCKEVMSRRAFRLARGWFSSAAIATALVATASADTLHPAGAGIRPQPAAVSCPVVLSAPSDVFNKVRHAYSPADICAACGVDALHAEGWTGQGQTIVIVDPYGSPTALQDLQTFSAYYGFFRADRVPVRVESMADQVDSGGEHYDRQPPTILVRRVQSGLRHHALEHGAGGR